MNRRLKIWLLLPLVIPLCLLARLGELAERAYWRLSGWVNDKKGGGG